MAEQNPEELISKLQAELNRPQTLVDKYGLDPVQEVSLYSVTNWNNQVAFLTRNRSNDCT